MSQSEMIKFDFSGNEKRIYLASPYTHEDEEVMTFRYREAIRASARLANKGYIVFSPIVHCHPIAVAYDLPKDYEFWQNYSTSFLLHWAEAISVLCLQGWKESIGIKAELVIGQGTDLPVYYIS